MNYEQAYAAYYQWAKNEAGDPDADPAIPNRGISEEIDGTWYLANVRGPLASVDESGNVDPPDDADTNWNEVCGYEE